MSESVCTNVCVLFSSGVKRACCDFLESQLDPSNCLGIRDFAETHNCLDLMQAAELFSQKHFSEVVQHEEFMLLSQTEVEKLIKCDEIQVVKLNAFQTEYNVKSLIFVTLELLYSSHQKHTATTKVRFGVEMPATKTEITLILRFTAFLTSFKHLGEKRVPACCNLSQCGPPPAKLTYEDLGLTMKLQRRKLDLSLPLCSGNSLFQPHAWLCENTVIITRRVKDHQFSLRFLLVIFVVFEIILDPTC